MPPVSESSKPYSLPDYVFELRNEQPPAFDMDGFQRLMRMCESLPPIEPIKLTAKQWDEAKTLLGPPVAGPVPLFSVPVHIVERVEDSTPYRWRLEKLAEEYSQIPYPEVTLTGEAPWGM